MLSVCPVIWLESSEAKKRAAWAIFSRLLMPKGHFRLSLLEYFPGITRQSQLKAGRIPSYGGADQGVVPYRLPLRSLPIQCLTRGNPPISCLR